MKNHVVSLLVVLALLTLALGFGGGAIAAPDKQDPKGRCGDGVCDKFEQEHPDLCPQDCRPQQVAEPIKAVEPTEGGWSGGEGEQEVPVEPVIVTQEGGEAAPSQQVNIAFILDGSGSMAAALPSGKTKLDVAKEVLPELISGVEPGIHGSLWIYGHRLPDEPKEESCKDIERVFALGPIDAAAYTNAIRGIAARGYTPIADSLTLAAQDFPVGENQANSIVLVSDGKETCGGDPCALAAALKKSGADVTIHVVGYDVDEETRQQLECIARVSGGTYRDAADAEVLREAVAGALEASQTDTILRLEVLGPDETQVSTLLHLYDPGTDSWVTQIGSWHNSGVTPGVYDIVIDTNPQLSYAQFEIPEGSTTVIRLNVASFEIMGEDGQRANPYRVALVDPASGETLAEIASPVEGPYYVLPGVYNLELYPSIGQASPEAVFTNVNLKPLEATIVGVGALDLRGLEGESIAPHGITFYDAATGEELAGFSGYSPEKYYLAPGSYYVELYWGISAYPRGVLKNLVIKPGETNVVNLGAYILQDPEGNAVNPDHEVTDAATGEIVGTYGGYSPDRYYFPAGTYNINSRWGDDFRAENVVIEPGKETIVKLVYSEE